jgi:uncharacterized protein (DUF1015 family)
VGCVGVDDYRAGRIKRHEHTRPEKEDDRTRHVSHVNANTGPVFLTCRGSDAIARLQHSWASTVPHVDVFVEETGVRHQLWRVGDPAALQGAGEAFDQVDAFYIADGHHRAASGARVRDLRRAVSPDADATVPWERFLAVVFPDDQVHIMAYNRVVFDLNDHSASAFLDAVRAVFNVVETDQAEPGQRGHFAMYLQGKWYALTPVNSPSASADPVSRLDVAYLQEHLLEPVLGIDDPRTNDRIAFVGGIRGSEALAQMVDTAGGGVAFALFPTSVSELLAVADAGRVMPPKSTWFEPKLASGLIIHPLG